MILMNKHDYRNLIKSFQISFVVVELLIYFVTIKTLLKKEVLSFSLCTQGIKMK